MQIQIGKIYKFHQILNELENFGYHRVPLVLNPGDYSVRGSIIDVFPGNQNLPVRIELFDDEIEDLRTFEPNTQHSITKISNTEILQLEEDHIHKAYVIPHEILFNLQIGDAVVHVNHGVGIYKGLERMKIQQFEGEYAVVEFQESDKIFIPIEQLTRIYKYTGATAPQVNSLRDEKWQKVKKRVKKAVKNVAKDLFHLYKTRKIKMGFSFDEESEYDLELDRTFPYKLTDDQKKAVEDVQKDMESTRAMDRLICGDVGFGKTEVAVRAVFKAVMSKKQVAVLTPTTLLSKQHYKVFNDRFAQFGVNVEYLNRFKTRKEQLLTIERMKSGQVDVVIGTHRLLQKDIEFKDLGLLVIDEEQRFGVMAKEKIKQVRTDVDVLTLSATPLPRTLYLSISGIRDISVINTPPLKRLPIVTEYHQFDINLIKERIKYELNRGGQLFLLHNRIHDIIHLQNKIKTVLPDIEVHIAHGRMKSRELEQLMLDFYENKFPVLLSTTIIENGIDIPNVHTIIIDDADRFGLAQLHQLRGRVGRNETQSYAFLLYKHDGILTPEVLDRFEALIQFTTLGSGYDISLRDLELRGIGNILGTEQSGYMEAVGFELYMHLLNEAISKEKGQDHQRKGLFSLSNKTAAYISEDYIPDMTIRLALYKQIAEIESLADIFKIKMECEDRYGPLPENLYVMMEVIKDSLGKE